MATTGNPAGAPPPGPMGQPPPPSPPPPRKGMSGGAKGAIVAVVVVIIVIIGLGFSGLIPGFKLGGSSSSGKSGPSYNVTFSESGLPSGSAGVFAGVSWSVTLGGSTQSSTSSAIVFSEQNGTYSFSASAAGFLPVPVSGSITVAGAAKAQLITFTALAAGSYTVTYTESGLTTGTSWSVTLNGSQLAATSTTILFTEKNGSYSYTVGAVTGYNAAPASGSITVAGQALLETITFSSTGGGSPGTATYSQAEPVAASTAGAGWKPVFAVGVSVTAQVTPGEWDQNLTNATCPLTGGSPPPTVPAYTGGYSAGSMEVWAVLMYTTSPTAAAKIILVYNGIGTNLGEISGPSCVSFYNNATISGSFIDSSTAATHFDANASAFVSAHSSASADWLLVPIITYSYEYMGTYFNYTYGGFWVGEYTTCNSNTGTGTEVNGTVNGTTGAVTGFSTNSSANCSDGIVPHLHLDSQGLEPGETTLLQLALKFARAL
ncbi:MAG: hypothetical protein WAN87_02485 [Thermoplasmata archaeon]